MDELPYADVVAVIPAFEEAQWIGPVVASSLRIVRSVLVVDDGSRDGTWEAAAEAGARIVRHAARCGKGAAIRTGLHEIRGGGHRWVLLLDGDGQHDPCDAPRLRSTAEEHDLDLVVGCRLEDREAHAPVRYYTNLVACNMLSRWLGHDVLDSQSGFRLIRSAALEGVAFDASGFEIETEMLVKLCHRGARVGYVPVRGVATGRKSRLRPVRDVTRICLSAVRYQYMSW